MTSYSIVRKLSKNMSELIIKTDHLSGKYSHYLHGHDTKGVGTITIIYLRVKLPPHQSPERAYFKLISDAN